ncbi:MAG: methyltransferase domain-containing protein [Nitrososphaerales archaeon]
MSRQAVPAGPTRPVADAFAELAPNYEQTVDQELRQFWGVSYRDFIELLLGRLDMDHAQAVLDVATGQGAIPLALAGRARWAGRVVGLDITAEMLRGAQLRLAEPGQRARVTLTCGSGMQLPFAANSFDAAICALATHHMRLDVLLAEMHRVLRPGGQLLVADVALATLWCSAGGRLLLHVLAWWYTRQENGARGAAEIDALPNMRTPEQWRQEVAAAGFGIIEASALPARRMWYPPGMLVAARANQSTGVARI